MCLPRYVAFVSLQHRTLCGSCSNIEAAKEGERGRAMHVSPRCTKHFCGSCFNTFIYSCSDTFCGSCSKTLCHTLPTLPHTCCSCSSTLYGSCSDTFCGSCSDTLCHTLPTLPLPTMPHTCGSCSSTLYGSCSDTFCGSCSDTLCHTLPTLPLPTLPHTFMVAAQTHFIYMAAAQTRFVVAAHTHFVAAAQAQFVAAAHTHGRSAAATGTREGKCLYLLTQNAFVLLKRICIFIVPTLLCGCCSYTHSRTAAAKRIQNSQRFGLTIHIQCIRYLWQGKHQKYGHIYGASIRFWPTLHKFCSKCVCVCVCWCVGAQQ